MGRFFPIKEYEGKEVFIIGGGTSLRNFNWELLAGRNVIGCNNAFRLGSVICPVCVFGDLKWFERFKWELVKYEGRLVTNCPALLNTTVDWISTMPRHKHGLSTSALGWNWNTGASAINLALIMGATKVYLLGFDGKLSEENKPNWHKYVIDTPSAEVYARMEKGFHAVAHDLPLVFPGTEIINLNPDSLFTSFAKQSWESVLLEQRKAKKRSKGKKTK